MLLISSAPAPGLLAFAAGGAAHVTEWTFGHVTGTLTPRPLSNVSVASVRAGGGVRGAGPFTCVVTCADDGHPVG